MKRIIPPNPLDDWLNQTYFASEFIYFDNWTFVHFSAGLLLGWLLSKKWKFSNNWLIAFGIIIGYEIFEFYFGGLFFNPETNADILWDIIIGMTGFFLSSYFVKKSQKQDKEKNLDEQLITDK